jgi:DNA mismatch repair protein MutS
MMQQYFAAKAEHPDVLMAMRVGDFYEFYGPDAETAAAALEITLTGRDDAENGRIAMAGVPFHSVERYLARLLQKGFRVALCDQLEDPKAAKGLVRRGVTRVLTPGTRVEESFLAAGEPSYLAALVRHEGRYGLAALEAGTGEFLATEIGGPDAAADVVQELGRIRPAEVLLAEDADALRPVVESLGAAAVGLTAPRVDRARRTLLGQFSTETLQGFGIEELPAAICAAALALEYAMRNGLGLAHVDRITTYALDRTMRLDTNTRRSLELSQNLTDGTMHRTLLGTLNFTLTRGGLRLLRRWVDQPLVQREPLEERLDAVERLLGHPEARESLRRLLRTVGDLERLVGRCAAGLAGPRDLAALRETLAQLPEVAPALLPVGVGRIQALRDAIGDHRPLARRITDALLPDVPAHLREGGVIADGFREDLDDLRRRRGEGKRFIAEIEAHERAATGIATLKVGYNSVFGYFLEVGKAHLERVPAHYIRKQTTANAERYITAELKEHEAQVLGADERAVVLEAEIFAELVREVTAASRPLLDTAAALAELDVLASLAEAAERRHYVRPSWSEDGVFAIRGGRHPVVELGEDSFVPNDLGLGGTAGTLHVITGPNMSGKSTFLRQAGLIVLMAQIGSFVPAESAVLGLCDRVFARIGAKDEIALGQSTFMVEMVEAANILNHATAKSLVILDEIGRGTSTFDGLAIAWAMAEHLAGVGARTLFATHYHQLNVLAEHLESVANYRVAVEELGEEIIWTHRVVPGGADRSYGIHVAKLAGVPTDVIVRAGEILGELEGEGQPVVSVRASTDAVQFRLFEPEPSELAAALRRLDVDDLTPLNALRLIDEWKRRFGR